MGSGREQQGGFWWRLWMSCIVVGGVLLLGGGTLRAVAIFSVFEPFTVQLAPTVSPEARLQSYRIAVSGTPYVWAGGMLFFAGIAGSVLMRWRALRVYGWLFMILVLAVLAFAVELWLAIRYDVPLVQRLTAGTALLEQLEGLVVERVRRAGALATLAACAEWTILLLVVWRPLERREHEGGTSGRGAA